MVQSITTHAAEPPLNRGCNQPVSPKVTMKLKAFICVLVLAGLLCVGVFGQSAAPQNLNSQANISALVQACIANGLKYDNQVIEYYTYTRKMTVRRGPRDVVKVEDIYPKTGRVRSKTGQRQWHRSIKAHRRKRTETRC